MRLKYVSKDVWQVIVTLYGTNWLPFYMLEEQTYIQVPSWSM